ncbi:uncharacterized protein MYCFIDRAFT_213065 [Pseudocercospora fijiensis CIRAD86]|uniref:Rab-GAP TBC domain-containing protein n=1 Tax=Pseudocercospora fijiensis (strain CIRAD86) TaxID=383855 RepID=N1QAF5_PSEFD|nr:uncharacterized protein MYCFIDRAFT_213065 [Pseudocercospora fijiensis CIRAD86]EME87908.1 hypothetical protein MYCFIDRAFT_213065 [Pseudocercospora fijiensis CIRAD86]
MRSLDDAKTSWQELAQYKTLRELKDGVRLDEHTSAATRGLRSICWKAFLLFDTLDIDDWQRTLASSRSAYNSLRAHFFRHIDNPEEIASGFDPLTQDPESSPWQQLRKDEELRAEIVQDVERQSILRQPSHRRMLTDLLFTYCKLNPDVGYRQGMHELAAPILCVVEGEAVDVGEASKTLGEDAIIKHLFDPEFVEHDSFALFGQVMQSAKTFYISEGPVSIATRSKHIFNELMAEIDPHLVKHLESLDVLPQVFLIRWIRLLFGREFEFESVLALWDVIFAEDPSLELVDHMCLAMLLRIRWHLLDADYNNALGLLLRYPDLDKDLPAQALGLDALYLRDHMNAEGSSYLVLKYTGRPLTSSNRPTTPPALQRNITQFSGLNAGVRHSKPSRNNIEAVLQSTAKNLFAQSERLGIGKAVRSTIDDIHKKAQEIRDSQAPSPPPWRRSGTPRVLERLREMEERNRRLSILLGQAVNELWECQGLVSGDQQVNDDDSTPNANVEKLSAAIARVQFVHVYLDQPTLVLPTEDEATQESGKGPTNIATSSRQEPEVDPDHSKTEAIGLPELTNDPVTGQETAVPHRPALADPSTFEDFDDSETHTDVKPETAASDSTTNVDEESKTVLLQGQSTPAKSPTPRPSLEQSPFSFMLGQDTSLREGQDGKRIPPSSQDKGNASLFGDMKATHRTPTHTPTGSASKFLADDGGKDEFDFGSLRRGKGPKR